MAIMLCGYTFHNPDNGFAMLRVATRWHSDLTAVVGHLASAIAGEFTEATGRWVVIHSGTW